MTIKTDYRKLDRLLTREGMTGDDLIMESGIDRASVKDYLRTFCDIRMKTALSMANALGCDISDFTFQPLVKLEPINDLGRMGAYKKYETASSFWFKFELAMTPLCRGTLTRFEGTFLSDNNEVHNELVYLGDDIFQCGFTMNGEFHELEGDCRHVRKPITFDAGDLLRITYKRYCIAPHADPFTFMKERRALVACEMSVTSLDDNYLSIDPGVIRWIYHFPFGGSFREEKIEIGNGFPTPRGKRRRG